MNLKHSLESLWNKALWLLIIPIGGVYALAHYGYSGTAGIIGFFYSFVFVSYAGFKTARWIYRKVTGWKHQAIKATELWQKMAAVYRLTEGPVINPTMLKEELLKTRDAGAAWDIALYSMVDRIIAIDPSAWVVSWRN